MLILSCQFIPQIIRNTLKGYRHVPELSYPVAFFAFNLYFPLYIYSFDRNIFFLRPDKSFVFLIVLIVSLQLYALKIQQRSPRFLMPRALRVAYLTRMRSNYYKYEHTFEEEAGRLSASYLSDSSAYQKLSDL